MPHVDFTCRSRIFIPTTTVVNAVCFHRGVQKVFRRVLEEREVEVHNEKEVIDVRDPPEGVAGGTGTLICKDGSEASYY